VSFGAVARMEQREIRATGAWRIVLVARISAAHPGIPAPSAIPAPDWHPGYGAERLRSGFNALKCPLCHFLGMVMKFRLTTFALHLAASAFVLLAVFGLLYFGWYAWPAWYLLGAGSMVGLIVLVDALLGPLLTLMIANPAKPRAELRRDIALIVLVQVAALVYGLFTLWQARPLFYALTLDRIELVTAADFDRSGLEQAAQRGAKIMPTWTSLPQWIWAPLPDNPEQAQAIVMSAIGGGGDVTSMPELFRPWADGVGALQKMLHPMPALKAQRGLDEAKYEKLLARLGRPESDFGWLLMQGPRRNGSMVFERASGRPVLFVQAEPRIAK